MNDKYNAYNRVLLEIKTEIIHYHALIDSESAKPSSCKINGEIYTKESELSDAYGCGFITRNQYERGIKTLENAHKDKIDFLNRCLKYWNALLDIYTTYVITPYGLKRKGKIDEIL